MAISFIFWIFFLESYQAKIKGLRLLELKESLVNFRFFIPTLPIQQKIAAILNAADAELRETKEYLEKLKAQKRGLMQQLLTGRVRVKTT